MNLNLNQIPSSQLSKVVEPQSPQTPQTSQPAPITKWHNYRGNNRRRQSSNLNLPTLHHSFFLTNNNPKREFKNHQIESLQETRLNSSTDNNVKQIEKKTEIRREEEDREKSTNNNNNTVSILEDKPSEKMTTFESQATTTTTSANVEVVEVTTNDDENGQQICPSLTVTGQITTKTEQQQQSVLIFDTFMTMITVKFKKLIELLNEAAIQNQNQQQAKIPTELFLDCCVDGFGLLDKFGSTTFMPIKMDVMGNIAKVRSRYFLDQVKYHHIDAIVDHEVESQTNKAKNSSTDALMWLCRAIRFLREFLDSFVDAEHPEMLESMSLAYSRTLRQHHNWVVRGIFAIAVRAMPSTDDFFRTLTENADDYNSNKVEFASQIKADMRYTIKAIGLCYSSIESTYSKHQLEFE